ncbi:PAS domain-containing protein [Neobacillus niacini]|uniref:helix-turn-helix transcriptional regulator n=1 Tax=Neobacillus niacini TaxID=86668 RepID=UPI00285E092A|nr:PAS domain-containing protein [Neobacillus niacini]MDR6998465.1 putative transcriptional regulator YheO [Neobacillus niacini]
MMVVTNVEKLKQYIPMVHFIADIMGENCEVVLHDVTNPDHSIIEIVNGHVSGRKINSPITDLALKIIKEESYKDRDYISNYKSSSKKNKTLRSSSYFIKDETNKIIGMICVNMDISDVLNARNILDQFIMIDKPKNDPVESSKPTFDAHLFENFEENIEELLLSLIKGVLAEYDIPAERMSPQEKIDVVKKLNEKGAFLLKGGVSEVAKYLDVSEATIYRYLHKIK